MHPRVVRLPPRTVAVVRHAGTEADVDQTRRPLYQHMVVSELVGGPSILRFLEVPGTGADNVDALVVTHLGFEGDDVCEVETLDGGEYAVLDYEGPPSGLRAQRQRLWDWVVKSGRRPVGPLLQVHLMDPVDGMTEQQLQIPLA